MPKRSRYGNGSARRKLRARVKAEGRPCALCGQPIDYTLPARHPWSYELDEIVPFSLGGSATDYSNVQPAHRMCNQRRGNKLLKKQIENETSSEDKKTILPVGTVSRW